MQLLKLHGQTFNFLCDGREYSFKVIHVKQFAVRITINRSNQNVWIPKRHLVLRNDGKIIDAKIKWKIRTKEFQHKLNLICSN